MERNCYCVHKPGETENEHEASAERNHLKKTLEYDERFKKAESRLNKLEAERQTHISRSNAINGFIKAMMDQPLVLNEWQDQLWNTLVQKVVIQADGTVEFIFKGENTITFRSE